MSIMSEQLALSNFHESNTRGMNHSFTRLLQLLFENLRLLIFDVLVHPIVLLFVNFGAVQKRLGLPPCRPLGTLRNTKFL
jgi:hypothetical protein